MLYQGVLWMQQSDGGLFDSMSSMFGSSSAVPTWTERYARIRSGRSLVYYEYSTVEGQINAKKLGSISLRRVTQLSADAAPPPADQVREHCFTLVRALACAHPPPSGLLRPCTPRQNTDHTPDLLAPRRPWNPLKARRRKCTYSLPKTLLPKLPGSRTYRR